MKKTFLILLISALGVWGYVLVQIVMAMAGKGMGEVRESQANSLPALALLAQATIALDTSFRDPFQPYLYAQKPAPAAPKTPSRPVLQVIEPPKAVLSGILWGDSPVAILKLGVETELVKVGAEVWDLKVKRVERHQVIVVKQGREFTLRY